MTLLKAFLTVGIIILAIAGAAQAQDPAPGVVVQGSSDVLSGGLPAARQNDATTTPGTGVEEGSSNVIINGRPADGPYRGQYVRLLAPSRKRSPAAPPSPD